MRCVPLIAVLAAAAALPAPAAARVQDPPPVWATVNICDTSAHPNEMGVRGSMPGLSRRTSMYMRFRVQFRRSNGRWKLLKSGPYTDSGWIRVGAGRKSDHDAGFSFSFRPPTTGGAHVLRGRVQFQWRRGAKVVESARAVTAAGHPGTVGADPAGFSAATCEIA